MAWIDDFTTSYLKTEIDAKFTPPPGSPAHVSFKALELACQGEASTETMVTDVVDAIILATGWKAKVSWSEQTIKFYK